LFPCAQDRESKKISTLKILDSRRAMRILSNIERIPGGTMLIPMACGAVVNTFAPALGPSLGSFTDALFTGALPILAVFYVCIGASIPFKSLPAIVKRGGALMLAKMLLSFAAAFCFGHLLGVQPVASGFFAGFSTLAAVVAINDTNGGLYMALMRKYGDAESAASYSVMALESGPFLSMLTLGLAGVAVFPWKTLLGAILPLLVGMFLGNLDLELRDFLSQGVSVLIPFFAFALGATLDLRIIVTAGPIGLLLGCVVFFASAIVLLLVDRMVGGDGTAGIAASTTAGNASAVPLLIAAADPAYRSAAASATVLVACSMVVTTLLASGTTAWWHTRVNSSRS
jgi:2-keto-3-deoxygluconate permease